MPPPVKLPPGAQLVDESQAMALPPGAELVPDVPDFTSNPKREGTYKMVAPGGGAIKLIDVPYSRVQDAFGAGYTLGKSGDDKRFAQDKFTELDKSGEEPNPNINYAGVTPTPAAGTAPWYMRKVHVGLDLLPTVGGIVGGAAGGGLGLETGPGAVLTGGIGAAAGAGLGETVRQTTEESLFPKQPKLTPAESAKSIGIEAGINGANELIGRAASRWVFSPAIRALRGTAEASEKAGFRMLPSEALGKAPSIFETYPKASILSRGRMAAWREAQNAETEQAAKDLADSVSKLSLSTTASREDAGNAIRKGIEDHMVRFRAVQSAMYDAIDKMTQGLSPSRKPMVAFAKKELDRLNASELAGGKVVMTPFRARLESIVDNKLPNAPFAAMKDLRSQLLAEAREDNSLMSGPEKGFLKKLSGIVDDSIYDELKSSGRKGLPDLWRKANSITREEHEAFEQKLIANLAAKKNPEDIALILRGNSPGAIAPLGIQETRDALSVIPKQLIPRVQKQILLDTMYESTKKGTQPFNEAAFAKSMLQIGDERGEVLFGANWKNIKEFSELLSKIKESQGLQAASLSNPEILKQGSRFIAETVAAAAGSYAAHGPTLMAAALPIMSEAALWNTAATALIHPQSAAKVLNAMRLLAKALPYAATGTVDETWGFKKALDRVKAWADKLKANPATTPPTLPSGITHTFDEQSGQIVPVG